MKKIAFLFLLGIQFTFAQKIDIKRDDVLLDGNKVLKYEKITLAEYSIKDASENELLHFQTKQDATTGETYLYFYFTSLKQKVESNNVGRISGFGAKHMMEKMLTWLFKDKVFNTDGTLNAEEIAIFKDKYNDR